MRQAGSCALGRDDEHYLAAIPDRSSAEEQVRDTVQPDPATVEALSAISAAELAEHKLRPGTIILAPRK